VLPLSLAHSSRVIIAVTLFKINLCLVEVFFDAVAVALLSNATLQKLSVVPCHHPWMTQRIIPPQIVYRYETISVTLPGFGREYSSNLEIVHYSTLYRS
jgi:hypothetical protein